MESHIFIMKKEKEIAFMLTERTWISGTLQVAVQAKKSNRICLITLMVKREKHVCKRMEGEDE